jgi:hypothetical protein
MTFGWGRRVCSGQGLAEQGTFITIARLLWGFNIQKALGPDGKEIPVDIFDYTSVIVLCEECRADRDSEMA